MTETIIVAALSFLGTLIGAFGGMRLMTYRIEQLEKKVDKHNTVIERTFILETEMKECTSDIKELKDALNRGR